MGGLVGEGYAGGGVVGCGGTSTTWAASMVLGISGAIVVGGKEGSARRLVIREVKAMFSRQCEEDKRR